MKTNRNRALSSSADEVTVVLPLSWEALTDKQLRYLCALLSENLYTMTEIKAYFLAREVPVIVGRGRRKPSSLAMALAVEKLDWMDTPPSLPVRLHTLHGVASVDAALHGVPFAEYLKIENLYQGYVISQSSEAIDTLASVLYPSITGHLKKDERYSILLWMVGLKAYFASMFPHLFKDSARESEEIDMREVMVTEIRALTGGDVTKETAVLAADTWSALTELDAKAREADEIERKNKHG